MSTADYIKQAPAAVLCEASLWDGGDLSTNL